LWKVDRELLRAQRQAVTLELECVHNVRPDRGGVMEDPGYTVSRVKLFPCAQAADAVAAFQDQHLATRLGQQSRGSQAIMSGPDHNRIVSHGSRPPSDGARPQQIAGGIGARSAHDAAPGMNGGPAHPEIPNGGAVARPSWG